MALDFPANPSDGEVFGSYIWSASKGVWQSREESAAPAVVSPVPPTTPTTGDIWVDSSDGISYVYYDDGSSGQWIEMISSGVPQLNTKANLDGGNTFTGTQILNTPLAVNSGGTGTSTGANLVPTGSIMMWFTNTPPSGWILCNGQSTTSYPELAAVVGATVPNLQGMVPVGRDTGQTEFNVLGETGGAKTHTLTTAQIPAHNHPITFSGQTFVNAGYGGYVASANGAAGAGGPTGQWSYSIGNTGGSGAHNNLQPYIVMNYIIKV
jgi:microcystin-dependent protein